MTMQRGEKEGMTWISLAHCVFGKEEKALKGHRIHLSKVMVCDSCEQTR